MIYPDWWARWGQATLEVSFISTTDESMSCDICDQKFLPGQKIGMANGYEEGVFWAHSKCVQDNRLCDLCHGHGEIRTSPPNPGEILSGISITALLGEATYWSKTHRKCVECEGKGYVNAGIVHP